MMEILCYLIIDVVLQCVITKLAVADAQAKKTIGIGGEDGFLARPGRVRPLWPSKHRPLVRLDGEWRFTVDSEGVGQEEKWFLDERRFTQRTQVPGNWNAQGIGGIGPALFKSRATGPMASVLPIHLVGSYYGTAWYCRKVNIPAEWIDRRVFITFGGVMPNLWLWLNGRFVVARSANGTPMRFEVTDWLKWDKDNLIVVQIDNREENTALFSHLNHYSRWGGLYHSVELEATWPVWIDSLRVIPNIDAQCAMAQVDVRNDTATKSRGELRILMTSLKDNTQFVAETEFDAKEDSITNTTVPVNIQPIHLWSPEHPELYRVDAFLQIDGKTVDSYSDRFGMRKLEVRGDKIYLNNHPFYIRGQHCNWFCVQTLSPPIEREEWYSYLSRCVEFGYNYLRAPWILPDEFFQIADEVGIIIQPSLDYVNNDEKFAPHGDKYLARQLSEVIRCFFNHPSLFQYELSNETWKGSERVTRLYHLAKQLDSTRLAIDSDGVFAENPPRPTNDIRLFHARMGSWRQYVEETFAVQPEDRIKPVVMHEYLNLPTLPDVGTISAYTAAMYAPSYLQDMDDWLEREGLSKDFSRYLKSSYKLQALYTKEGIEVCRKHPFKDGYSNCSWSDMTPTAVMWGVLNQFLEEKGITAEESHRYNSPSVILVNLPTSGRSGSAVIPNYTYYMDEDLEVEFLVHDFAEAPIGGGKLKWALDGNGETLAAGSLGSVEVMPYSLTKCGRIKISAIRRSHPCKATLSVRLEADQQILENQWELWFFPRVNSARLELEKIFVGENIRPALQRLYAHEKFTASLEDASLAVVEELNEVNDYLASGGHVLLLSVADFPSVQTGFWPGWYGSGNRNLGAVVEAHPALQDFPHDDFASWQFRFLLDKGVIFSDNDVCIEPIVSGIIRPTFNTAALPKAVAHLFETKVGRGSLLATGMRLLEERPEAEYLLDCLIYFKLQDRN